MMIVAVVFMLGMGWTWLTRAEDWTSMEGQISSPQEGFLAPDFTLEDQHGTSLMLSEFRGDVVVVNLWASWCAPCRAEMPALQQVYEEYQDQGVIILAVNATYQDSAEDAMAFAEEMGLSFPVLLDRRGVVSRQYQLRAMPSTFFINQDGIINKVILGGPISEATFKTAIEELLREGS
jgi:peroxiredoxin